jgi:hypothetical protein
LTRQASTDRWARGPTSGPRLSAGFYFQKIIINLEADFFELKLILEINSAKRKGNLKTFL